MVSSISFMLSHTKYLYLKKLLATKFVLGPVYMVRLCHMRQAHDRPMTGIVSCKSNLHLAYDCRVRQKQRRILKHVF